MFLFVFQNFLGHKSECPHKDCICQRCAITSQRQEAMKQNIYLTRSLRKEKKRRKKVLNDNLNIMQFPDSSNIPEEDVEEKKEEEVDKIWFDFQEILTICKEKDAFERVLFFEFWKSGYDKERFNIHDLINKGICTYCYLILKFCCILVICNRKCFISIMCPI